MNTATPTVLILGARGRFGSAAVQAFSQAGWRVLAQARPGATGLAQAPGVRWLQLAPQETAALVSAAAGATVVVHALSPVYTHKAWRRDVPLLTQAAIDVTRALGATLLLPAGVYNFGEGMPARLQEDTPQLATTFKGRMRIASERMIEEATRDGRMKATVIRGGDFFGSGAGSWLDEVVVKSLRSGRMTYPGAMDVRTSWAYLPDMARAFVHVARQCDRLAPFETMHFAGHSLTGAQWRDALQAIAREQGWLAPAAPLKVQRLPWSLVRLAGLVMPTMAALAEMRYLWRTPHSLVNRRMAALTGPEPHTPFPQALREALAGLGLIDGKAPAAAPVLS